MQNNRALHEASQNLRNRAERHLEATGLLDFFEQKFGAAALTGSVRYDLMVWPDVDIHMPVEPSHRGEWAAILAELYPRLESAGLRLHKAQFLDDYVDPHPLGAGLYWGLQLVDGEAMVWKMDIWGWAPIDYERRQERDAALRAKLQSADRNLILRLKTEARSRPDYCGSQVSSMDVYRFVLAKAGSSLGELEAWLAGSGSAKA